MMRVIVLLVALPLLGQPAFAQPVERESLLDAYFQVADYGMNALMSDLARLCSKVKGLRGRELERCATSEVKKHLAMELLPPDPAGRVPHGTHAGVVASRLEPAADAAATLGQHDDFRHRDSAGRHRGPCGVRGPGGWRGRRIVRRPEPSVAVEGGGGIAARPRLRRLGYTAVGR